MKKVIAVISVLLILVTLILLIMLQSDFEILDQYSNCSTKANEISSQFGLEQGDKYYEENCSPMINEQKFFLKQPFQIIIMFISFGLVWLLMLGHAIFTNPVGQRTFRIILLLLLAPIGIIYHLAYGFIHHEFDAVQRT